MIFNMLVGECKIPINTVPSSNSSFTYDGNTKTPVWQNYDAEQLVISGTTSAINAGTYTVYFTPKEGYAWSDGTTTPKEVTWSIAKAVGTLSLSATSGTIYGHHEKGTFTVTCNGDGAISAVSSNTSIATVSVSGKTVTIQAKAIGSATITVSVAEGANYSASNSAKYSLTVDYLWLFKDGNQFTSVTGGWVKASYVRYSGENGDAGSFSVGNTINLQDNGGPVSISARTKNKINVTNYNTVTVAFSGNGYVLASSGTSGVPTVLGAEGAKSIDISGLSGSYYIGVMARNWMTMSVSAIRLS